MDARPKTTRPVRDNFLRDAVHPPTKNLTLADGFRFGVGFFTAHLLLAVIIGGLAWALVVAFKLHA